jgi:hypothetical protein
MGKIEGTELDINEADEVVLDYWLSGDAETKEEWAQRVWNLCEEYRETDGKGHPISGYGNKGMPSVYAQSPFFLWDQKKRKRRVRFYQEIMSGKEYKKHFTKNEEEKIYGNHSIINRENFYPPEICDAVILELKKHPKYKTRTNRHLEEKINQEAINKKNEAIQAKKLEFYEAQGRSEEEILMTHPELVGAIHIKKNSKGKAIERKRGKGS